MGSTSWSGGPACSTISSATAAAPAPYHGRRLALTQPQWPSSSDASAATRFAVS